MENTRWAWADTVKGIAIILVVLNHAGEGLVSAGIARHSAVWLAFHDLCFTFMVPVFFLLAGWFAEISSKSLSRRAAVVCSNLVYPYLLWSFLQAALLIVTHAGNSTAEWRDLPGILLNGWMQFWFLHGLILLIILDLIFRAARIPREVRMLTAIVLMSLNMSGIHHPWVLGRLSGNIIYFETGVFISTLNLSITRFRSLLFMALACGLLLFIFQIHGAGHLTPLRPLGAMAGIAACCAVSRMICLRTNAVSRALQMTGRYSLQIFVLHSILSAGVRVMLLRPGVRDAAVHFLLGSAAALVGALAVARFDERFLKILFRLPFGVPPWRSRGKPVPHGA